MFTTQQDASRAVAKNGAPRVDPSSPLPSATHDGFESPSTRELEILKELKRQLNYTAGDAQVARGGSLAPTAHTASHGALGSSSTTQRFEAWQEHVVDIYLLRFLRSKRYSIPDAIGKLNRRRIFEHSLTTISLTPNVVSILRSGAISILGRDCARRPILYVRMSAVSMPPFDSGDAERLVVVLMEYMQAQCAVGYMRSSDANASRTCAPQFTLLINEENAHWHVHEPLLDRASALHTLIQKYYPELTGLVLIVGATWNVRQGLKAALTASNDQVKRSVQLIARTELCKYMDVTAIPQELGGRNKELLTPVEFSDAVLRHWYAYTSYLQLENLNESITQASGMRRRVRSGGARPLWQLPPLILTSSLYSDMERLAITGWAPGAQSQHSQYLAAHRPPHLVSIPLSRLNSTSRRSKGNQGQGSLHSLISEDDGQCSVLSETEGDLTGTFRTAINSGTENFCVEPSLFCAAAGVIATGGMNTSDNADGSDTRGDCKEEEVGGKGELVRHLRQEHERRVALENQLHRLQFGVTVDDASLTRMERRLRSIHDEVSTLVADVVLRAKAASNNGSSPSLTQMLDVTVSALNASIRQREPVPAMSAATPAVGRQPKQSLCTIQ